MSGLHPTYINDGCFLRNIVRTLRAACLTYKRLTACPLSLPSPAGGEGILWLTYNGNDLYPAQIAARRVGMTGAKKEDCPPHYRLAG